MAISSFFLRDARWLIEKYLTPISIIDRFQRMRTVIHFDETGH
jgi:hypothetical protein